MIYFTRDEATQFIKIGYTGGLGQDRVRSLQTGSAGSLVLMFEIEGSKQDETAWHERFASARVRGEWFRPVPELLLAIAEEKLVQFEKEKARLQAQLDAERERVSVARAQLGSLSVSLGVGQSILRRGSVPGPALGSPLEEENARLKAQIEAERRARKSALQNIMKMLEGPAELPVQRAVIYGHSDESSALPES